MDNNDLGRRIRYALQLDDADTARLTSLGGYPADVDSAAAWRMKDSEAGHQACPDAALSALLSGLVLERRGPPAPSTVAATPRKPDTLDNNTILKTIKIALSLRSDDLRDCIIAGGGEVTVSEIGSLLRRPDARNFRGCGDQMLRRFLSGLAQRERTTTVGTDGGAAE